MFSVQEDLGLIIAITHNKKEGRGTDRRGEGRGAEKGQISETNTHWTLESNRSLHSQLSCPSQPPGFLICDTARVQSEHKAFMCCPTQGILQTYSLSFYSSATGVPCGEAQVSLSPTAVPTSVRWKCV